MKTFTHTPVCDPIVWAQLSGLLALLYVGRHTVILSPSATLATETYCKVAHWHNYLKNFISKSNGVSIRRVQFAPNSRIGPETNAQFFFRIYE